MPLFYVQDSDRPMYVVAHNWKGALQRWENRIREENKDAIKEDESVDPAGISFICDDNDLIA